MDEHSHKILVTLVFFMGISQVKKKTSFHHSQTTTKVQQEERKMKRDEMRKK
jgi:hypothetical protein